VSKSSWFDRTVYWQLEVSFWLSAVEAGVKPVLARSYRSDPASYVPHTVDFQYPPSREDFLQVVSQIPWMHVWQDNLLPIIAKHDWPMIDFAHKAASVELKTDTGVLVGRLDVCRQEFFRNQPYSTLMVTATDLDQVVNRLPKEKRSDAFALLRSRDHHMQERLSKLGRPPEDADLKQAIRAVLIEGGFINDRRKAASARRPVGS